MVQGTSGSSQRHLQACLGLIGCQQTELGQSGYLEAGQGQSGHHQRGLGHVGPGQAGHLQLELGQSVEQTAQRETEHHWHELGHQAGHHEAEHHWHELGRYHVAKQYLYFSHDPQFKQYNVSR